MAMLAAAVCLTASGAISAAPWEPAAGLPADSDPLADPTAVVSCDAATRFSILGDRLIRAEFSDRGVFEDRATLAIIHRAGTPPPFKVANASGWCNITVQSSGLRLSYRKRPAAGGGASRPFERHRLSVTDGVHTWNAGDAATANLGGTVSTLSMVDGAVPLNCTGKTAPGTPAGGGKGATDMHCTLGVVSRDGWAVVNDTFDAVVAEDDWVAMNPSGDGDDAATAWESNADLYIFLFGRDYRAAIGALNTLSGRQPVPPRSSFGLAWSKYWQYDAAELRAEVTDGFERHGLPLDLLNIDTAWHRNFCYLETEGDGLCEGQPDPWEKKGSVKGYGGVFEWDETLFPPAGPGAVDPASGANRASENPMITWLRARNLSAYLDVHQCPGIWPENRNYAKVAAAMGMPPADIAAGKNIRILVENRTFNREFFNTLLQDQAGDSVYWWIDLCMPPEGYTALPHWRFNWPLWNLWMFYRDMERRIGRGSNLAWFGGLGSQRYPMGHSGDVIMSWESLQFQPRFTATAANLNFGYWSHDLGGHKPNPTNESVSRDPELYLRWLQWGTFAPTLRTHMEHGKTRSTATATGGQSGRTENVWLYPEPFGPAMGDALRLRSRLVPYIYTAALATYSDGVSLVHPVYFDHPMDDAVYDPAFAAQFLFGDAILVAPIVTPRDRATNLTNHTAYLPSGRWVEMGSLRCLGGGQQVTTGYTLTEAGGAYVKEGAVLPMALEPSRLTDGADPTETGDFFAALGVEDAAAADGRHPLLGGAQEIPRTLVWEAFLGNASSGSGTVSEDATEGNSYMPATAGGASAIAVTTANFTVGSAGDSLRFVVRGVKGSYRGMPERRNYEVRLRGAWAPTSVTVAAAGSGTPVNIPVAPGRRPRVACGKLLCGGGSTVASWWWDAQTMTAFARVDNVEVATGVSLDFAFGATLHHGLLHSADMRLALPTMLARVLAVKHAVDAELWLGTLPSLVLNRLAATADRIQIAPNTAESELRGLGAQLQAAVSMHTAGGGKAGLPTPELQAVMRAWLLPRVA